MGDYTLCHLHFALKNETPKYITNAIQNRMRRKPVELPPDIGYTAEQLNQVFHMTSAYHQEPIYCHAEVRRSEFYYVIECLRITGTYQAKHGRGIHEFVKFISPWVIVDESNRGCVGYALTEYCHKPTYLFVKNERPDEQLKYIHELEEKIADFIQKEREKE